MRRLWFVAAALLGLMMLCAALLGLMLLCAAPDALQSLQLARLRHAMASIPLGEGQVVGSSSRRGHIWGQSCDAEVWVLVASRATPEAFVAGLPLTVDLPEPGGGPVPWYLAFDVWKVTDDGGVLSVGPNGRTVPLAEDGTMLGDLPWLEPVERDDLDALVAAYPVAPGLNRYALQARAEFDDHGLPFECPR